MLLSKRCEEDKLVSRLDPFGQFSFKSAYVVARSSLGSEEMEEAHKQLFIKSDSGIGFSVSI